MFDLIFKIKQNLVVLLSKLRIMTSVVNYKFQTVCASIRVGLKNLIKIRFDHIYKKLQASKQRLCGNPCTNSKEAFHFAMAFALIRLLATLTPTFSRYNSQLQSTWMDIPFHLKFIFNFYMELQLFVFCSMLELCFNSIRVRLSRLRKYAPINSLSQCGMVLVDR